MQRAVLRPSSAAYPNTPAGQGSICTVSMSVTPRFARAAWYSGCSFVVNTAFIASVINSADRMPSTARHSRTSPWVTDTTVSINVSSAPGTMRTRTSRSMGSPGFHDATSSLGVSWSTTCAKRAPSGTSPVALSTAIALVISSPVSMSSGCAMSGKLSLVFDARELVGLLADEPRRRVVAALVLDASTLDDIRQITGLDARSAARALQRLVDSGLVLRDEDGRLHLLGEAFAMAARAAAESEPRPVEHADAPPDTARVLRVFVRDGRLTSIPAVRSKRLVILDWLVQRFEPGRRYSEQMVN